MKNRNVIKIKFKEIILKEPEIFSETVFQIATLIISIFAFSFLVGSISIAASPVVSALESSVCCEKTKDKNLFCQNSIAANCDDTLGHSQTLCSSTDYCKLGCCIDTTEGTCGENTPKKVCDLRNGTWDLSASCNIAQCQKGCCISGDKASLTTLVRCKKLASFYGLETDYRSEIISEATCVNIAQAEDKGACLINTGLETTCKLTTKVQCNGITHNASAFNKEFLCSAKELGTPCTRQASTGCIEGKDEVYWFDSCGNTENIYDSNKDRSWNNGKILEKSKSCDLIKGNTRNPLCGNCKYSEGSICGKARTGIEPKPAYGDYICRNVDCEDTFNGNDYKHGESWCVYDATVGQGKDLVGSRHWRHLCVMGEEQVEPCEDYRQSICVENKVKTDEGDFNEAVCKINDWRSCIDYNNKANPQSLCSNNKDCYPLAAWKMNLCMPQVPSGFEMRDSDSASTICGMATQQCTVVYTKKLSGWECTLNCECKEQSWANQMNKWCTSLGDCGGKYNLAGSYEKGYQMSGGQAPNEDSSGSDKGAGSGGGMMSYLPMAGTALGAYMMLKGGAVVAAGTVLVAGTTVTSGVVAVTQASGVVVSFTATAASPVTITASGAVQGGVSASGAVSAGGGGATTGSGGAAAGITGWLNGMTTMGPLLAIAAVAIAGFFIGKMMGLDDTASAIAAGVGVATAVTLQVLHQMGVQMFTNLAFTGLFIWGMVAAIIMIIIFKFILGVGKTKKEVISFTCLPWQPPSGGANCEKCNTLPIGGDMKQCSKYRCESLGAACSLLNEGTGNETCAWLNKDDINAPTLKPWKDVLTSGHKYRDDACKEAGCWTILRDIATDGCIQPYTSIAFGIETNEPSQCKIDYASKEKFDDMEFYFGENLYLYNHSVQMSMPAPEHIYEISKIFAEENPEEGIVPVRNGGNYTLYLRCRDANGNANAKEFSVSFCVDSGPDLNAPLIMRTSIENGAPIGYGTNSVPIDISLNEPSQCKWSNLDQDYGDMTQNFTCSDSIEQMEGDMTYKCSANLLGVKDATTNIFYFRCKDQPWLAGKNESGRNDNKESYIFKLEGTNPLKIIGKGPEETIYSGGENTEIILTVDTSEGYSYGDSVCYFSNTGYENMLQFFTTGEAHHEQTLNLPLGDHTFYLSCMDLAGNVDKTTISFTAELDKTPPEVIKAYQDGGMLKIITDEESDCRYGIKDCNFDFFSATEMPVADLGEYNAEWRTDATYYIKCMDKFGNIPSNSECTIKLNAYNVE
ncbi:MAG: hypothetical protein V1660_03865 [archaeon]